MDSIEPLHQLDNEINFGLRWLEQNTNKCVCYHQSIIKVSEKPRAKVLAKGRPTLQKETTNCTKGQSALIFTVDFTVNLAFHGTLTVSFTADCGKSTVDSRKAQYLPNDCFSL